MCTLRCLEPLPLLLFLAGEMAGRKNKMQPNSNGIWYCSLYGVREVEVSPESSVRAAILFKSLMVAVEPASKTNSQPALPACKLINMKSSL